MLKCPYCWIFPHWFVKCLYGIFLLPLFSTSIGIVKDRYLRMAENWRKISTRKTPNSKNLLSQCFSLWCVCTFVLLSSTYFPHTGAEVDVPPADLAGPWQENAPTSPPPWCSPTTAEDRWGGRGQATHRGCRWSLVVEKRQEKIISGAQLNQQVVKSHFPQSLLMELETERASGDFLLWLLYGGVHSQLWQVYEKWRKKFNCIATEKMPESHLDQMIENAVEGVLPSEKRDGTDVLLTRGCNEPFALFDCQKSSLIVNSLGSFRSTSF